MELFVALTTQSAELWIAHGGYIVLFGLLFACGLGFPMPEEIPLLTAGVLIGTGQMYWPIAAACAWTGIVGGDCCLYGFGRHYGRHVSRLWWIGKHITPSRYDRAAQLFHRHGVWVILGGRMLAGVRLWMVIAAGMLRYHFGRFLLVNGLGAMISAGIVIALGYWAGRSMGSIENVVAGLHSIQHWLLAGLITAVVVLLVVWLARRVGRRKEAAMSPADGGAAELRPEPSELRPATGEMRTGTAAESD